MVWITPFSPVEFDTLSHDSCICPGAVEIDVSLVNATSVLSKSTSTPSTKDISSVLQRFHESDVYE